MGSFLAAAEQKFDWTILILSILTATFLQILSNLSNDYGDSVHGADSESRVGPKRAVQAGHISSASMKKAIWLFSILSLVTGITLLIVAIKFSPVNFLILFLIGLLSIVAAIKYTAGDNPYGYAGLGDISVFIFFGLVGVLGTYYLQAQSLSFDLVLPAASCGLFSVAVLNVNNIRDIESDKHAGKKSIPVRIGRQNAVIYHWSLLITGVTGTAIYTSINYHHFFQWLFLLSLPLLVVNGIMVWKIKDSAKLNPYLKQMAISTLIFVLSFGAGLLLSTSFAF
jgi:1,4-dihydroxy-2-naphthoate polyprenyltransferase